MKNDIFNIIIEAGNKEDLKVFSAVRVQCPVWVVHLRMDCRDNDSFFPVDRSILALLDENPSGKPAEISSLIGLDAPFVQARMEELLEEGMIEKKETGRFLTEAARVRYFNETGERPTVVIYDDLVLDGYSLKPLDKEFYASRAPFSSRRSDMIVPRVIMGNDDPALVRAVRAVEKLNGKEKESLLLEHDSWNYEILGFEAKSIDNVYVVLAVNRQTGKGERRIFFKDRFIPKVDAIAATLDNYYLSMRDGECHCSCGFMPQDGNPLVAMTVSGIENYLSLRYGLKEVSRQDYMYTSQISGDGEYPLTVVVSQEMLDRSEDPRRLMDDAMHGKIVEKTKEGTFKHRTGGYFLIPVKNIIPEKVEHYRALRAWQKQKGRADISFIRSLDPAWDSWREDFVKLGLLAELEDIDISQFIDENRKEETDYE